MTSNLPWKNIKEYNDILFQQYKGIAKISINRPHKHNAFTPVTVQEMSEAMELARQDTSWVLSF
jgi:naphthoate synthase